MKTVAHRTNTVDRGIALPTPPVRPDSLPSLCGTSRVYPSSDGPEPTSSRGCKSNGRQAGRLQRPARGLQRAQDATRHYRSSSVGAVSDLGGAMRCFGRRSSCARFVGDRAADQRNFVALGESHRLGGDGTERRWMRLARSPRSAGVSRAGPWTRRRRSLGASGRAGGPGDPGIENHLTSTLGDLPEADSCKQFA